MCAGTTRTGQSHPGVCTAPVGIVRPLTTLFLRALSSKCGVRVGATQNSKRVSQSGVWRVMREMMQCGVCELCASV